MSEKYVRKNRNSFAIVKGSRIYGKFTCLEDALFVRDLLIENGWNLEAIQNIYEIGEEYLILAVIDEKVCLLDKSDIKPSQDEIEILTKRKIRNPNNSKYGLNITRVFDTFAIKKRIAGEDHIFGLYDNLADAEFVRNFLLDNMWNVNAISQIQHDEDSDTYKVVEVIDDRAYVLGTFKNNKIDLNRVHEEFLSKISKHKFGLAVHPYLDDLTGKIPELEERFGVSANDDVWTLKDTEDPLNDIIFNMTPFQKAVYDSLDGEMTVDEIAQALVRYRSGNFNEKIERNLDGLVASGVIVKNENHYKKVNFK
jgi:hypothetical protein